MPSLGFCGHHLRCFLKTEPTTVQLPRPRATALGLVLTQGTASERCSVDPAPRPPRALGS